MGANQFCNNGSGLTAKEAFSDLVDDALFEYGHRGYTGTIAEKSSFIMIQPNEGETPSQCARRLLSSDDRRIDDKWGPAGCIKVSDGKWLFFGWASS